MLIFDVHVAKGNTKTGPIPTTSRPMTTCPADCPFLPTGNGGCYGTGRIFHNAAKKATVRTIADVVKQVNAETPRAAKYLRDRVVGDVLGEDGRLDTEYIHNIAEVGRQTGLTVFGYTHAWKQFSPADVAFIKSEGYVMNASTESAADVQRAIDLGMPVVIVNDDREDGDMIAGRRIVTCPAELREDVTCASCGLCAKANRTVLIRFNTHGTAVAKARRAIAAAQEQEEEAAA